MPIADFEHPLYGAHLRWRRTQERVDEIQAFIEAVVEAHREVVSTDPQTGAITEARYRSPDKERIKHDLAQVSVRFGEAIYNLRAALDYLVYELARHDSGSPQQGTQFPFESKSKTFWDVRVNGTDKGVFLRGVSLDHARAIEKLQPYAGCEWTARLRDFSNPDKHKELHPVWGRLMPDFWNMINVREVPDTRAGAEPGAVVTEMQVNLGTTFYIAFPDGASVVQTLGEFHTEVGGVLSQFEAEFEA